MKRIAILSIIFLVAVILIMLLQIYLCKKKNQRLGLILPAITFILAILYVLISYSYNQIPSYNVIGVIIGMVVWNIPTAILLMIYFTVKNKDISEMDRMKIEDL